MGIGEGEKFSIEMTVKNTGENSWFLCATTGFVTRCIIAPGSGFPIYLEPEEEYTATFEYNVPDEAGVGHMRIQAWACNGQCQLQVNLDTSYVTIFVGDFTNTTTTTSTTTTTIDGETSTTSTVDTPATSTTRVCPLEQIFGEHSEQTELLRYIRDTVLARTATGQEIIRLYYQWSPAIIKAMGKDQGFKEDVKELIDGVLGLIIEETE